MPQIFIILTLSLQMELWVSLSLKDPFTNFKKQYFEKSLDLDPLA